MIKLAGRKTRYVSSHNICTFFNCFILQWFIFSIWSCCRRCRGEAGAEVTGAGGECGAAGTTAVQAGAGREKTEGQTETGASGESAAVCAGTGEAGAALLLMMLLLTLVLLKLKLELEKEVLNAARDRTA